MRKTSEVLSGNRPFRQPHPFDLPGPAGRRAAARPGGALPDGYRHQLRAQSQTVAILPRLPGTLRALADPRLQRVPIEDQPRPFRRKERRSI